jgi:GYF domain 2
MFTIIGVDGKEYGPVSADQVKDWIVAGRANGQTKVKREGTTEWKSLAEYPELAVLLGAQPPPVAAAAPAVPVDPKAYAADLIARAPKLLIGDMIGRGWDLLKANFWPLVGVTLVTYLVSVVVGAIPLVGLLLWGVFVGGLYNYYLKRLRGQPAALGDAFGGFTLAFVPLMLAGLVSWLLTVVGFICLVIPGIYLAVAWVFTMPLVIDRKLEFWTAMEVSRRVVTAQWWRIFGLLILAWLIAVLGLLGCGIGFFVTLPIAIGAVASAYDTLCNPPPKAG